MKLTAQTDSGEFEITIEEVDGNLRAWIDERELDYKVTQPEPGVYLLRQGPRVFEVYVGRDQGASTVQVNGKEVNVSVFDKRKLRGSGSGAGSTDGVVEITTAMPGKVVRLMVSEGDRVGAGDGIVVVEAMKMQNELKSPKEGSVKEILVSEDDSVESGAILAVIE